MEEKDSEAPAKTKARQEDIRMRTPYAVTEVSAICGLLLFVMAFSYTFLAVSITKKEVQTLKRCSCSGPPNKYSQSNILACKDDVNITGSSSGGAATARQAGSASTSPKQFRELNDRYCANILTEELAGSIGSIIGFFQALAASTFLFTGIPKNIKVIWAAMHVPFVLGAAASALMVLSVYIYKFKNPQPFPLQGITVEGPYFYHEGAPTTPTRGNSVVLGYFAIAMIDFLATAIGIPLGFLSYNAKKV